MTDTHETRAGGLERVEHCPRRRSEPQIRMAHNPRAGAKAAIQSACALRGDAVYELDLPHGLQRVAARRIVKRPAFDEDRGDDVVPAVGVLMERIEGVIGRIDQRREEGMPWLGKRGQQRAQVPQVVVRIDDRQFGLERGFRWHGMLLREFRVLTDRLASGNGPSV